MIEVTWIDPIAREHFTQVHGNWDDALDALGFLRMNAKWAGPIRKLRDPSDQTLIQYAFKFRSSQGTPCYIYAARVRSLTTADEID